MVAPEWLHTCNKSADQENSIKLTALLSPVLGSWTNFATAQAGVRYPILSVQSRQESSAGAGQ